MCTAATYKQKISISAEPLIMNFPTVMKSPSHHETTHSISVILIKPLTLTMPSSEWLMWPETIHSTMMPLMKKVSAWQV